MTELSTKRCVACEGGMSALNPDAIEKLQAQLDAGWEVNPEGKELVRDIHFKNYYETMAFVNAIAWMAHQQNHHPDLEVSYNHCKIRYSTHFLNGLSENDFICAAKVDAIFRLP